MSSNTKNMSKSSGIIPFAFSGRDIRVIEKSSEPLFVGKDVCSALGYANDSDAMKQHCRGVVKRYPISDSLGRTQKVRVLTEGDVMRLIVRSKLPAAQAFEALVFDTILPTIRRTGSYNPPSPGALTAQETGGIVKGVVNKALAPFEERQKQLEARLDAVMNSYDPSCAFVTDYHPMAHVVNNHGIPQSKRRSIVVKCSNRCAKFLQRNGMGGMIRCTRERNTRIFHRDGIEKWLLAEGKELLLNARDVALGQRAMRFSTIKGGKA